MTRRRAMMTTRAMAAAADRLLAADAAPAVAVAVRVADELLRRNGATKMTVMIKVRRRAARPR